MHARVSLNGKDLGLYVLREAVDRRFLMAELKTAHGKFFQGSYGIDVDGPLVSTMDDDAVPFDFASLRHALDLSDPELGYRTASRWVDWDAFCRFLALEMLTCHVDSYTQSLNNYRVCVPDLRPSGREGPSNRLLLIPSGMDQMFGNPYASLVPFSTARLTRTLLGSSAGRSG